MSKHWKPDESVLHPLPRGKRLKSLDEFTLPDFVGRMDRVRRQHRLPEGGRAGLVLVAAACVGIALGLYQAFSSPEAFAPGAEAEWDAADEPARR